MNHVLFPYVSIFVTPALIAFQFGRFDIRVSIPTLGIGCITSRLLLVRTTGSTMKISKTNPFPKSVSQTQHFKPLLPLPIHPKETRGLDPIFRAELFLNLPTRHREIFGACTGFRFPNPRNTLHPLLAPCVSLGLKNA
jgi:hypothetical protein